MNRFYIEKLVVSGGGHKTTVIDFKPGLNFILGPSNTGKSLIMDCIVLPQEKIDLLKS